MAETRETKSFGNLTGLVASPGGAVLEIANAAHASLTTNQGVIVAASQSALKSSARNSPLLDNFPFRVTSLSSLVSVARDIKAAKYRRVRAYLSEATHDRD
jgi:hypothetical protein